MPKRDPKVHKPPKVAAKSKSRSERAVSSSSSSDDDSASASTLDFTSRSEALPESELGKNSSSHKVSSSASEAAHGQSEEESNPLKEPSSSVASSHVTSAQADDECVMDTEKTPEELVSISTSKDLHSISEDFITLFSNTMDLHSISDSIYPDPSLPSEERRALWASINEQVRQTFWPTEADLKQFEKVTGSAPHYGRIFTNAAFRKCWAGFQSGSKTEEQRKLLLDFITLLMAPKPKPACKAGVATKRSSSGKGASPPSAKLSRKVGSSSTGQVSASPADKVDHDNGEEGKATFAAKARPPGYSPYLLHIYASRLEKEPINRDQFRLLYEQLQALIFERLSENLVLPRIMWSAPKSDHGLIAPADRESKTIVQQLISQIKVGDTRFRAWGPGESDQITPISLSLPPSLADDKYTAPKLLEAILQQNTSLPRGAENYKRVERLRSAKTQAPFLRLVVSRMVLDIIKQLGGQLHVLGSRLPVFTQGQSLIPPSKNQDGGK